MAESINRSNLEAFQNYVQDYSAELKDLSLRGAPSLMYFTPVPGVKGRLIMAWSEILDILKPWAAAFSAGADTVNLTTVTIESHFQKAELSITPKSDLLTWRGFLTQTKQDPETYPFVRYVMEKAAQKIATQQEFDQIFTGDQLGTPVNAADVYNGLLTLIADDQGLGTPVLTPVATGALASGTIIAQVEQVDDAINEQYRRSGFRMFVSPSVFKMYRRAYRTANGYHPAYSDLDNQNEIQLDGSSTILTSCPGMGTSNRIICTPSDNIWHAYDAEDDKRVWEFDIDHRTIDMWCDHWSGTGFFIFDDRVLVINDQA